MNNQQFQLSPLSALIRDMYPEPLVQQMYPEHQSGGTFRHGDKQHTYLVPIGEEVERFTAYHLNYAQPNLPEVQVENYIKSLIEQMIAHFEPNQSQAVQSFVGHYVKMITENVSPNWIYHPLRYIKQMDADGYRNYVYCLYGFAEDVYNALVSHGLFSPAGTLLASFEAYDLGTLYLVLRPELPHVLSY